ncbi:MAG: hypothetical protein KBS35_02290 [Mycoplasma sp.]|nr:hypothetical protein [Candidatus Hennigella equi]
MKENKELYPDYDGFLMKTNSVKDQTDEFMKCHYIEVFDKEDSKFGGGKLFNLWNLKGQTGPFKKTHYVAVIGSYDHELKFIKVWDIENDKKSTYYGDSMVLMVVNNVKNKIYWDDNINKAQTKGVNETQPPEWFNKYNKEIISPALLEVRTKQTEYNTEVENLTKRLEDLEDKFNAEQFKKKGDTL